jgi:hypothetical protein
MGRKSKKKTLTTKGTENTEKRKQKPEGGTDITG